MPTTIALLLMGSGGFFSLAKAAPILRPAAAPAFSIRPVGSALATYQPNAINSTGLVVGSITSGATPKGFFYAKNTAHTAKSPAGMMGSEILGVSDFGRIAGSACVTADCGTTRAFTGTIRKGRLSWKSLPPPKGASLCGIQGCDSLANAIAGSGDIGGQFANRATLWLSGSKGAYRAKRLPFTDSQLTRSTGYAVDTFGDVAGTEGESTFNSGVFWPRGGSPVNLPACQNVLVIGGATFEYPFAMLAKGNASKRTLTIVGDCLVKSPAAQLVHVPCLWQVSIHGSAVKIAAPVRLDANDGSVGTAVGINQKKWISGNLGDSANPAATLWIKHQPQGLDGLIPSGSGWSLGGVSGMNSKGQITGVGMDQAQPRAFLLSPK